MRENLRGLNSSRMRGVSYHLTITRLSCRECLEDETINSSVHT